MEGLGAMADLTGGMADLTGGMADLTGGMMGDISDLADLTGVTGGLTPEELEKEKVRQCALLCSV